MSLLSSARALYEKTIKPTVGLISSDINKSKVQRQQNEAMLKTAGNDLVKKFIKTPLFNMGKDPYYVPKQVGTGLQKVGKKVSASSGSGLMGYATNPQQFITGKIGGSMLESYGNTLKRLNKLSSPGYLSKTPNPIKTPGKFLASPQFEDIANIPDFIPGMAAVSSIGGFGADSLKYLSKTDEFAKALKSVNAFSDIKEGKTMFNIADKGAFIKVNEIKDAIKNSRLSKLSWVLDHPKLYKEYPELKNVNVAFDAKGANGFFDRAKNIIHLDSDLINNAKRSTILHEVSHALDNIEGRSTGTSSLVEGVGKYKSNLSELRARSVESNSLLSPKELKGKDLLAKQVIKDRVNPTDIWMNTKGGKVMSEPLKPIEMTVEELKDIGNTQKGWSDVYRNFKTVYGPKFKEIKTQILDPFDTSKSKMVDELNSFADSLDANIVKKLGIKKGSKESALVQLFGEGKITEADLIDKVGSSSATKIKEADTFFRNNYNKLLDEVNAVRASIYPNDPTKIIPKRQDYYRHFTEMEEGLSGLKNIFDSPAGIESSLAGISEFTKPKSKWLSFAQQRTGDNTTVDAVGGFIDYVQKAVYAKNIDPNIQNFRNLAKSLEGATLDGPNAGKVNNFIEFLHDFSNDLSGKSTPLARVVQKYIPGGRKAMRALDWVNKRVKANVILGNASSSVAQIFNVPQGIADAGIDNSVKGLGRTLADVFSKSKEMEKSGFLKERYFRAFDKFDTGFLKEPKKLAVWMTSVLDEVGTKYIWNSEYERALKEGIPDAIKFADDQTRKMVAGRGIGEVPIMQKDKVMQLIAPFQLEVGNLWSVMKDWVDAKEFGKLATFFVVSHIFNRGAKSIRGSDVSFDPITASIEAMEAFNNEEDKKTGALKAAGRLGGEVLSNIPFGQSIAATYPEQGATIGSVDLPPRSDLFGEGDPTRFGGGILATKGLKDPLTYLAAPFGGTQIKRSVEGLKTYTKGISETKTGRTRFEVEKNPTNLVKSILFGQYATKEGQSYIDNMGKSKVSIVLETLKKATPEERASSIKWIQENQPDVYKGLVKESTYKRLGITGKERSLLNLSVADRARTVDNTMNKMSKQEAVAYIQKLIEAKIVTKDTYAELVRIRNK